MINRILMELYDDYSLGNIDRLYEFANKTFPLDGTNDLFVGCLLIMFSRTSGFKARYSCTREELLSVVLAAKQKIGNTNMLAFYVDRLNTIKNVHKYLDKVVNDDSLDKYANLIIEYLEQFKPSFLTEISKYESKINDFIKD